MKKYFKYVALSILVAGVSSCAKEEIGGTKVQDMCGEWYVTIDGVDSEGNVIYEDPYGYGYIPVYTYNTNADLDTEMYLEDSGFWYFRTIVNVNYANKTFSVKDAVMYYDEDPETGEPYPVHVDIENGRIVKDGATSPAGYTADSISFFVRFEDDEDAQEGYWDYLWYHGYRRTGLNGGYD